MAVRYFEFIDDKSQKFWEVTVSGSDVTVRYGRIGSDGQSKNEVAGRRSDRRSSHGKNDCRKDREGLSGNRRRLIAAAGTTHNSHGRPTALTESSEEEDTSTGAISTSPK